MNKFDKKPQPGDLIEIFRGIYQHWAIYVGDGYVIHLVPPSEYAHAGANSMMSVLHERAKVKKENLYEVVGDHDYRINNFLDDKYEPRPIHEILQDAYSVLGQERSYSVFSGNCEHFVTELRYGKAHSRQVRKAVEMGVAAGISFGVLAYAVVKIFGSNNKEKQTQ
ncbi:retinoic acid receptor responder 3 [Danio rerio]|uniref:Retinoic acid receptor responder 3 n=2 Tax=Danio rerio TaxID=7955 RepID=A0A0R4INS8_DANRE|nr:retinoic acid receptor responder 3 [Danio rerio]|eukprot:NP_001070094.2 uncharacterized protein LOC767688 [Danio rerio]